MVNSGQMNTLKQLLEVRYLMEQTAIADLLRRENRLRADLAKLDQHARSADTPDGTRMQLIGADILWKAWVGRAKSSLNVELAQVLAQKESVFHRVQQEFGKMSVGDFLTERLDTAQKKSAAEQALKSIIEQHVMKSHKSG